MTTVTKKQQDGAAKVQQDLTAAAMKKVAPEDRERARRDAEMARRLPRDESAEAGVIGSMIIDPSVIGPVCMFLKSPEVFCSEPNQILFRVLVELYEQNIPIDAMILHSTLKNKGILNMVGGIEYIKDMANSVPTSTHAEYYAALVKEKYVRRKAITTFNRGLREAWYGTMPADALINHVEQQFFELHDPTQATATAIPDVIHETFEQLDRQTGDHYSGIRSGFVDLDNMTSGLQRGDLIIIAARPSVGKTAFVTNIVEHVGVDQKRACAVFSMEMSKQQIAQRMLCSRSGIDSHKLRRGMLNQQERDRLSYAVGQLAEGKIYIDDTPGLTLMDLRTKARRLKLQYNIELIAIDYLQLMECPGRADNRQQEISAISRGIKALARELNVPILCLSQLNRASESENRMPRTSDLRESGAIEQDADVVMLLHREAVMRRGDQEWMDANPDKINLAIVNVAKQRNGPCDLAKLTFLSACTRFVNYAPGV